MPNIDDTAPPTKPAPTVEELMRPTKEAAARLRGMRMTKQELEYALIYMAGYSARGVGYALDQTERDRAAAASAKRMARRRAG